MQRIDSEVKMLKKELKESKLLCQELKSNHKMDQLLKKEDEKMLTYYMEIKHLNACTVVGTLQYQRNTETGS